MTSVSKASAALGFLLVFATCPIVYTALFPFAGTGFLQVLFVSAAIGTAIVSLYVSLGLGGRRSRDGDGPDAGGDVRGEARRAAGNRPGVGNARGWRVRVRDAFRTFAGLASRHGLAIAAAVYLLGIAGFEAVVVGVSAQLLAIASGLALGSSLPFLMLAWAKALCSESLSVNLVAVGCLCGGGAGLSWLMGSLDATTLPLVHAALSVASMALLLAGVHDDAPARRIPSGDVSAPDVPLGEAFSRMMSIAFVPLAGLVIFTLFTSMSLFYSEERFVVLGVDGAMFGFVLACAVVALIGVARPKTPLLDVLCKLVIPLGIVAILLGIAIRQETEGSMSYEVTSLLIMTFIPFLAVLAIAICCTLSGTGEFEPSLAIGPLLVTYSATYLLSLPLQQIFEASEDWVREVVMAVCLALLLVYQIISLWRTALSPQAGDTEAGIAAETSAAVEFQSACERICRQHELSKRESEIFAYLARGYSFTYIAGQFTLSENTVRTHSKNIYRKLGVSSREELLDLVGDAVYPKSGASGQGGKQ